MKWTTFSFLAVFVALFAVRPASAQTAVLVENRSGVVIEGSSNVSSFACRAGSVDGRGRVAETGKLRTEVLLIIPVRSLDCGNPRMNADLFAALKADDHPTIRFEMDGATVVGYRSSGSVELEVSGTITVAGVARNVQTRVVGDRLAEGHFRAAGAIRLSMSDFEIDPPTALLGLVRTRDRINVRFDLVAATAGSASAVNSAFAH